MSANRAQAPVRGRNRTSRAGERAIPNASAARSNATPGLALRHRDPALSRPNGVRLQPLHNGHEFDRRFARVTRELL